ncbi:hypothetical protein MIND_00763200 [Mycena indigotica]|uniref:Tat pathway signal sequence n=1 Tax=Mycena indigotica TaxID=2126181 RepID=A0A8H6SM73_9AGAR|nr:uncharacterized protein MIND_00763200 [Mycena indigotica]KAF7301971.1 hypothetical protein MIND_00763200 [Mycena indigotica]
MPEAPYTPLYESEEAKLLADPEELQPVRFQHVLDQTSTRRQLQLKLLLIASLLFNLICVGLFFAWRGSQRAAPTGVIYSPAQSAIEYKLVQFTKGFDLDRPGGIPIYDEEPSDEGDAAWEELYARPEIRVPKSEARKMYNATFPIENDPGYYFLSLEVFHQLHCLDKIRHQLNPERGYEMLPADHIRHCFGAIRQALMCYGDVTPVVFQWSEVFKQVVQRDDITHECRDYSKIRAWADEHQRVGPEPDFTVYVDPDLD